MIIRTPILCTAVATSLFFLAPSSRAVENTPLAPSAPTAIPQLRAATSEEKDVFSALDLSLPELAAVKEAVAAQDYDRATHALAVYLRERTSVPWFIDPNQKSSQVKFNQKVADDAVAGTLQGGWVPVKHTFPEGKIDWFYNATGQTPDQPPNDEWQWQLNRMMFWDDLGNAYAATGDEKYARTFVDHLRSWTAQCSVIPNELEYRAKSPWRPIEAGLRMGNSWPIAYQRFLHSTSFTDNDVLTFVHSCLDHGRYLMTFGVKDGGNHLTMAMSGLYAVGALFPEFSEAKSWRTTAADRIAGDASRQFLPDGGQYELTPGYHNVALENLLKIAEIARMTGHGNEISPEYMSVIEKAYGFDLALMTPDRLLPRFNDSWALSADYLYKKAVSLFPERQDFQWALSRGVQGREPSPVSLFLNWSGYAVMRSGWGMTDNYLVFDVGPLGVAHSHQDKLGVVLWAWGRRLLMDNGGGSYEKSKWRDWSISTASHNCVLVDGFSQNVPEDWTPAEARAKDPRYVSQAPIDAGWVSTPAYDYARGTFAGEYGPKREKVAAQTREVFFLKPDIFIVRDTLVPGDKGNHTYQARWHLASTEIKSDKESGVVRTADQDVPNLAIVPLAKNGLEVRTVSAQEAPEILGWEIIKDGKPARLPATTVLHTIQGVGTQQFLTLLLPLRPGQEYPITRISGSDSFRILFQDGRCIEVKTPADAPLRVTQVAAAKSTTALLHSITLLHNPG